MKNKLLSQLWCLLFSCHGVCAALMLLCCTCTGHLPQAEEPRHLCSLALLGEQHLTLAGERAWALHHALSARSHHPLSAAL